MRSSDRNRPLRSLPSPNGPPAHPASIPAAPKTPHLVPTRYPPTTPCPVRPCAPRLLPRTPFLPPSPYAATWANVGACVPNPEASRPNCVPVAARGPVGGLAGPGAWCAGPPVLGWSLCLGPRPAGWAGWRLWRRRPPAVPGLGVLLAPLSPLSPPSRAAQGGRDHAAVPRSRTACVSRGALSVVGRTYEGRRPGRLSRSCMPLRSLFTRSWSVREILRPEVIGLPIEAVVAA